MDLLSVDDIKQSTVMSNQTPSGDPLCGRFLYDPYAIPALYFLIFPIALLLNGVAAWVSLHLESTNTFVVYLKNLVAADLIMTTLIPFVAVSNLPDSSTTTLILSCRFISSIFYSTLYTSITLLGFIGLDRFFKIMAPQSKIGQSLIFSKVASVSVWLVLFGGSALPNIILSNQPALNTTEMVTCMLMKGPAGLDFHQATVIFVTTLFWLVSAVMTVCYVCITKKVIRSFKNSGSSNTEGKQKIKLRVFLVVIVFFVLFVPYHIVRIPYTILQVNSFSRIDCFYLQIRFAKDVTLWIANTNICMDPILYVFLCREFKEKLVSMMGKVFSMFVAAPAQEVDATLEQSSI